MIYACTLCMVCQTEELRESLMCNMYVAALISMLLNNIILVIFADNEKEEEMQIGYPTDVKHVAHIGADGPSANTPSWVGFFYFIFLVFLNFFLSCRTKIFCNQKMNIEV